MGRLNKTGVRGLCRETITDETGKTVDRWSIDLRYRDPSGLWQRYRERLPDGISAAAAKERARKVNNSAAAGTLQAATVETKTVGAAFDAYIEWAKTNRPASYQSKRTQSRNLQRLLGRETRLDDLGAFAIEKFKATRRAEIAGKRKAKGKAASDFAGSASINRALGTLKHACGLFVDWKWMRPAVAQAVRSVKLVKEPAGRVRCFTPDEEARILAKLPTGVQRILRAATLSGMRRAEVCLLRRDAVDLAGRELTLTKTKNGSVGRIPINDSLAALLEEAMAGHDSEYVFLNRKGRPYRPDSITTAFQDAAQAAGVRDARFHDSRHSFATRLRRKGVQLDVLQDLGRWSSLTMVRRYSHVGREQLHAAVAQLDEPSDRIAQDCGSTEDGEEEKPNKMKVVR